MKRNNLIKITFYSIICILVLTNCKNESKNKKYNEIKNTLELWIGKKIYLSNMLIHAADSNRYNHSILLEKKIVVYIDTTSCTECRLHLQEWNVKIRELKNNIRFIFIVNPKKYEIAKSIFCREKLESMLFQDMNNEFKYKNKILSNVKYQTFLLDEKNNIQVIGDPIGNDKLWKLYKDYSKNRIHTNKKSLLTFKRTAICKTTIQLGNDSVNFGKIKFHTVQLAMFKIQNTGKNSLVIQSVNTSCGCTMAKYDKKPIGMGQTTTLILEFKPNSLGYFSKIADVVCNVPKGYVRLKISGEVVEK